MRTRGFTLVDMLVTITLMGVMAIICWRALDFVGAQRGEVEREAGSIAGLVRTFAQLERDLAERLPDGALPPSRQASELPLAVSVLPNQLEILRFAPQAGMMVAQYRIEAAGLARNDVMLLPGATALKVRVHAGGFWIELGDPRVQPRVPAAAVEVSVENPAGRYVKVLIL